MTQPTAESAAGRAADRPLPVIDDDNREFWDSCRAHAMRLQKCGSCGAFRYYPTPVCPACTSFDFSWEPVSGRATLYTYSAVHRPPSPAFAAEVPYLYAVVELEEGPMMATNLVDVAEADARIGMSVELCYDDVTPDVTLPKFRPAGR